METDQIRAAQPAGWVPISDPLWLAILGKAMEESGEVTTILARSLIQGFDGRDPGTGKLNTDGISDEIADNLAMFQVIIDRLGLDRAKIEDRKEAKIEFREKWLDMIERDKVDPDKAFHEVLKVSLRLLEAAPDGAAASGLRSLLSDTWDEKLVATIGRPADHAFNGADDFERFLSSDVLIEGSVIVMAASSYNRMISNADAAPRFDPVSQHELLLRGQVGYWTNTAGQPSLRAPIFTDHFAHPDLRWARHGIAIHNL